MKNNEQQPPRLEDQRVKTLDDTSEVLSNKAPVSNKEKPSINDGFYFLESMLNTMLNPILYKDRNGVYRGVNDIFSRQLIGLPEEEIVGYTLPEVCEKFIERFPSRSIINGRHIKEICREWDLVDAELLKSGGRKIHEQEVVLVDGSKATFLVNRSTFNNYNGDIIGLVTVLQDITESKQSKKALEENEERYRIVAEQTGQLVYDNNIDNNRISWAGAIEEVFGYNVEEVKKFRLEDWIDHIHPEDRKYVLEIFMQARKTGGRSRVQYRLRKKDGTYIYVEDTGTYLQNEIGEPYRVLGVVGDITEQKLTHKQLEENEEKYHIITEQTGQLVYDYDFKSEKGNWGGAIEEITGYLPQDFQGISFEVWSEHIHPEDRESIIKQIMEIQKEGGKYRLEFRFRKKDGTYFYAEDNGVCLLAENGKPYRILGVIRDITERKLAQNKLEISEERYRSFIHNFKGIAFQLDENLVPEFVHGAVEEITGYSEDDFMSKRVWWIDIVHPEDVPAFSKQVTRIKNSQRTYDTKFEYRIKRKDGKTKWINQLYQKIPGKDGKPDKYQGAVYDITDKKEAEETLYEIKEARIKEIHHRIKNNLQVISSLLDLQAEKFEDEKVREAFRETQSRIISMALIHEELYQERNMETLNFTAYLHKLSENLFKTYRLDHPGISLQMDLKEDVFLNIDTAVPLGIVINELISNSLKYAFPEQKRGEIKIILYKEEEGENLPAEGGNKELKNKKLILTVSDSGIGLPESIDIENPDTLGLQLVNTLVDQLDGKLQLKRDKGTVFVISINIAEDSENI